MRKLTALLAAGLVLGFSGMAMALDSDSITVTATATVIAPLYVAQITPMNFGKFSGGNGSGGTISIDASDSRTASGGSGIQLAGGVTAKAGEFEVTGQPTYHYDIPAIASTVLTDGTSSRDMAVSFTRSQTTGILDGTTGKNSFKVLPTLTVAGAQVAGTYQGSYIVTVTYQ